MQSRSPPIASPERTTSIPQTSRKTRFCSDDTARVKQYRITSARLTVHFNPDVPVTRLKAGLPDLNWMYPITLCMKDAAGGPNN